MFIVAKRSPISATAELLLFLPPLSSLFVCLSLCLFVCLLATLRENFSTDLHEIFREAWQWAIEQMIKFWWRYPDRDTGNLPVSRAIRCGSPPKFNHLWQGVP